MISRAFLRPINVEENLIESRNRALISSLAYLRMLILFSGSWKGVGCVQFAWRVGGIMGKDDSNFLRAIRDNDLKINRTFQS